MADIEGIIESGTDRESLRAAVLALGLSLLAALSLGATGRTQTIERKPIDYETLCKLPPYAPRRAAWKAATPASRAETMKTHNERWMAAHRSELNKSQVDALTALIATITPLSYADGPDGEAARARAIPVQNAATKLFSSAQLREMSPTDGDCIPRNK